jgi:ATP-dependent DNA ligase
MKRKEKEGIILKNLDSTYRFGKRSHDWLKCKVWKDDKMTFTRYEENPAGVTVENDNGVRVQVAGKQADRVKLNIKNHGKVTLEVQYLEVTKNGCYRQPTCKRVVS